MAFTSVDFGTAPMTVSSFAPSLKIMTVGMERMPYSVATLGLSSVLSLSARNLSPYSLEISSMSGAIMRHGPHQGAQKSTSTGTGLFNTSSSNVASVTTFAATNTVNK